MYGSAPCHSAAADSLLRSGGEDLLRRTGLDEVARHVGALESAVAEAHVALRRDERAVALGITSVASSAAAVDRNAERARRHARQAREALKRHMAGEAWRELKQAYGRRKKEMEATLDEGRREWVDGILAGDVPPVDAAEMVRLWDEASDALRKRGIAGLAKHFDDTLSEFDSVMSADRDYAREHRSPLEWWKWLIIIAIVCIAIAALIACLIWSGCSWIKEIFIATCWAIGWTGVCAGFRF